VNEIRKEAVYLQWAKRKDIHEVYSLPGHYTCLFTPFRLKEQAFFMPVQQEASVEVFLRFPPEKTRTPLVRSLSANRVGRSRPNNSRQPLPIGPGPQDTANALGGANKGEEEGTDPPESENAFLTKELAFCPVISLYER